MQKKKKAFIYYS